MSLTPAGRTILGQLPGAAPGSWTGVIGCHILRNEPLCIGCGLCVEACPSGAMAQAATLEVGQLYEAPPGGPRGELGLALRRVARHLPSAPVEVPDRLRALRTVSFDPRRCLGCGACVRACPTGAIEALPLTRAELEDCGATA